MAHIHEKIDFTVDVFIVHDNRVLLRKHDKYHIWIGVGGHIELDEDPIQAAIREVKEEVGLEITLHSAKPPRVYDEKFRELIVPEFLNRHRISQAHEHISFVYIATAITTTITPAEGEDAECKWFSAKELDDLQYQISDNVKTYARHALLVLGTGLDK